MQSEEDGEGKMKISRNEETTGIYISERILRRCQNVKPNHLIAKVENT